MWSCSPQERSIRTPLFLGLMNRHWLDDQIRQQQWFSIGHGTLVGIWSVMATHYPVDFRTSPLGDCRAFEFDIDVMVANLQTGAGHPTGQWKIHTNKPPVQPELAGDLPSSSKIESLLIWISHRQQVAKTIRLPKQSLNWKDSPGALCCAGRIRASHPQVQLQFELSSVAGCFVVISPIECLTR